MDAGPHEESEILVGNDPQQELHILGQKYPTTTDIVIGWVLAHNNKS